MNTQTFFLRFLYIIIQTKCLYINITSEAFADMCMSLVFRDTSCFFHSHIYICIHNMNLYKWWHMKLFICVLCTKAVFYCRKPSKCVFTLYLGHRQASVREIMTTHIVTVQLKPCQLSKISTFLEIRKTALRFMTVPDLYNSVLASRLV